MGGAGICRRLLRSGAHNGCVPEEDAMRKRMMVALVGAVCACAGVSRANEDGLSGTWRGVVRRGVLESTVLIEFSRSEGGYTGRYWGSAPVGAPLSVTGIEFGHSVRFEVPRLGVFEGEFGPGTLEGTFEDAEGKGAFQLQKQSEKDNPLLSI
jgi:hypothetical protein